jgi:hypothetical protein
MDGGYERKREFIWFSFDSGFWIGTLFTKLNGLYDNNDFFTWHLNGEQGKWKERVMERIGGCMG